MQLTVTGWDRNHGEKEIFDDDPALGVDVIVNRDGTRSAAVSHVAPMKLSGTYRIRVMLSASEIARLFYETHADLPTIATIAALAAEKERQEKEKAQRLEYEAKMEAKNKGIRRL